MNDQNDKNWLKIKAVGKSSNLDAIGAKIKVYFGKQLLAVREVATATGFCSQQPLVQHFGLPADGSYRVAVTFPSGVEVVLDNVTAGQTLRVAETK